jgi:hypothetical protein
VSLKLCPAWDLAVPEVRERPLTPEDNADARSSNSVRISRSVSEIIEIEIWFHPGFSRNKNATATTKERAMAEAHYPNRVQISQTVSEILVFEIGSQAGFSLIVSARALCNVPAIAYAN